MTSSRFDFLLSAQDLTDKAYHIATRLASELGGYLPGNRNLFSGGTCAAFSAPNRSLLPCLSNPDQHHSVAGDLAFILPVEITQILLSP